MKTDKYTVYQVADPRVQLMKMVRNADGAERWVTRTTLVKYQEDLDFLYDNVAQTAEQLEELKSQFTHSEETPFGLKVFLQDGTWVIMRDLADGTRAYNRGGVTAQLNDYHNKEEV